MGEGTRLNLAVQGEFHRIDGCFGSEVVHPRSKACFPRVEMHGSQLRKVGIGKEVQHRIKKCDSRSGLKPDWCDTDSPWWDFDSYEYRIIPTTTLRPWTADEVPLGAWLRSKESGWKALIFEVRPDGQMEINNSSITPYSALRYLEHSTDGGKTWLPCGVEEEGK